MMKHTIVLFCANARLIIVGERTISKFLLLKSQQAHTIHYIYTEGFQQRFFSVCPMILLPVRLSLSQHN